MLSRNRKIGLWCWFVTVIFTVIFFSVTLWIIDIHKPHPAQKIVGNDAGGFLTLVKTHGTRYEGAYLFKEGKEFSEIVLRIEGGYVPNPEQISTICFDEFSKASLKSFSPAWIEIVFKDDGNPSITTSMTVSDSNPIPDGERRKLIIGK